MRKDALKRFEVQDVAFYKQFASKGQKHGSSTFLIWLVEAKLADDLLIVELDATASLEATVYIDGTNVSPLVKMPKNDDAGKLLSSAESNILHFNYGTLFLAR